MGSTQPTSRLRPRFLRQREAERRLAKVVSGASEAVFAKVWDDPDDAGHDGDRAARGAKARAMIEDLPGDGQRPVAALTRAAGAERPCNMHLRFIRLSE
jgi:hypothetical protein